MNWDSIRVVSWDVDGTLYNIRRMKEQGVAILLASIFRGEFVSGCREIRALFRFRDRMREIRQAGGDYSVKPDPHLRCLLLEYSSRWWAPATARVGLLKGVSEMIAALSERGIRQVVLSDYHSDAKLRVLGVHDAFEKVYAAEKIGYLKPSRAVFQHVFDDLGIEPHELVHIGDREDTDGIGARGSGATGLIIGQDFSDFRSLVKTLVD